jgi:hypothetical protein
MLIALLVFLLVAVCFVVKELVGIHRQVSSLRQFLEWTAVGFQETRDLRPAQRAYLEKVKEDLIREGKLSKQQVDDLL